MKKKYVFENGAKLLYYTNTINKATVVKVSFDCGSRCDGDIAGLSHFCEHMFFTGTENETKEEITKQYFNFIKVNAYTNTQEICFKGELITDEFESYLNLVAKMILESTFSSKNIEDEKEVVIQEIVTDNSRYDNQSTRLFSHLAYDKKYYFDGTLGNVDSVKSIKSSDVINYVNKYFVSNNCRIYVSSPYSFNKVKKIVNNSIIKKLRFDKDFLALPYDADEVVDISISKLDHFEIDKNYFKFGFKTPYNYSQLDKISALSILCGIVSDISHGLLKILRIDKSLVYYISLFVNANKHDCEFIITSEISKDKIKECVKSCIEYFKSLTQNGITQSMLDKQKREQKYYYDTNIIKPSNLVEILEQERNYNKIVTKKEEYNILKTVTVEDMNGVIKTIFDNPKFICHIFGNAEKEDVYSLKEIEKMF